MTTKTAKVVLGAIANTDWMMKGKCKETDLTTLDDIKDHKTRKATAEYYKQTLCFQCPVRDVCLSYIIQREYKERVPPSGLWGGTYEKERTPLRRAFRDTRIPIEILVSRWIAGKALYDSKFLLTAVDKETRKDLKEVNANTPHGVRIMQGKLRRQYTQEIEVWVLDTTSGKSKLVDPSLPR